MTVSIHQERPDGAPAVHQVHEQAFGGREEACLVEPLGARGEVVISRAASAQDRVVGHIVFSRVSLQGRADAPGGLELAPLAALPVLQHLGIGSHLVTEGLSACRDGGFAFVVVLGEPAFYRRFGFRPGVDHGLRSQFDSGDAFMALELRRGSLGRCAATVTYSPAFMEFGVD